MVVFLMSEIADLECQRISKNFQDFVAVEEVSFSVPKGTFFSILGPSGCGKTTLLRMIAGFQEPTSGELLIKNKSVLNVPPNKRQVSMVFQHLALFPMMNIDANVGFGLRQRGVGREDIKKRVETVLARVGLPGLGGRSINQLSGGQKQRVAIARCMVLEPDVLLLDEPLGALDLKLREHMKIELKKLQAEFDTTFVYITHDQSEALVMSDQIAVMNHGKFEQVGTARELYYEPKTSFVAGFVGEANKYEAVVSSKNGQFIKLTTSEGLNLAGVDAGNCLDTGDKAVVFVRPEAVRMSLEKSEMSDMDNYSSGAIENILFNGANSLLLVKDHSNGAEINISMPQTGEFRELVRGDVVHFGWDGKQTRCYKFDGVRQNAL